MVVEHQQALCDGQTPLCACVYCSSHAAGLLCIHQRTCEPPDKQQASSHITLPLPLLPNTFTHAHTHVYPCTHVYACTCTHRYALVSYDNGELVVDKEELMPRSLQLHEGLAHGDVVEVLDTWVDSSYPGSILASRAFTQVCVWMCSHSGLVSSAS